MQTEQILPSPNLIIMTIGNPCYTDFDVLVMRVWRPGMPEKAHISRIHPGHKYSRVLDFLTCAGWLGHWCGPYTELFPGIFLRLERQKAEFKEWLYRGGFKSKWDKMDYEYIKILVSGVSYNQADEIGQWQLLLCCVKWSIKSLRVTLLNNNFPNEKVYWLLIYLLCGSLKSHFLRPPW